MKKKIEGAIYKMEEVIWNICEKFMDYFDEKKHPVRLLILQVALASVTSVITTCIIRKTQ